MTSTNPLVSVPELAAAYDGPHRPTVIDVRWSLTGPSGVEAYRAGHLPGAGYADLDRDLADPPGDGGRHPLPDESAFQEAMRRLGVRGDRPVVAYDQRDSTIAARLWWLLRYFGHPDVRVLDGGFEAWQRAGHPVAYGDEPPMGEREERSEAESRRASERRVSEPGDFVVRPGGTAVVDADGAREVARRGRLLDARVAVRYRGEVEPIDPVAGHIPGAVSASTFDNVDELGHFRPADELRARFAGLGVTPAMEVAAYCGSGVTAAHEVLALRLAGFDAALYVGSWSEWIRDPGREVARSPATEHPKHAD